MKIGKCFDCRFFQKFKARPDERERYGFGENGYGCKATGYEGYVTDPTDPPCGSIKYAAKGTKP